MRFSAQTDDPKLLEEAANSSCDGVRFGPEFCEFKMPTLEVLEEAYETIHGRGKRFTYVTPRLSNRGIERLKKHLASLDEKGDVSVVANDLGTLRILGCYPNLHPELGRQLTRVPARSLWVDTIVGDGGIFARKWFNNVFSSTSLDYPLTMDLYRRFGVRSVDVDWIPRVFPQFSSIMEQGFALSIHLNLVPVTVTRKCHEARFIGEKDPETCSMPCLKKAFFLRNEMFNIEMFLLGNAVFRVVQPSRETIQKLGENQRVEFVIAINPITGFDSRQKVDSFILSMTG